MVAVGRPRLEYAAMGVAYYAERLRRYLPLELHYAKADKDLLFLSEGFYRVVLDERGTLLTTEALYRRFLDWEGRRVAFLVGGAEGHPEEVRQKGDFLLALSPLTLQHELALLVLLEQLYRLATLRAGHPYHR